MADPAQRVIDVRVRVRYPEADPMGYLHHAQYPIYFEMGRIELFRAQGGDYRAMEERGQFLVLAELAVKYRAAARFDDLLTVRTTLSALSIARMEHEYAVYRGDTLLTTGRTVLACVDREGRIVKLSEALFNYDALADRA
jgi:acyl-CoA thioester hydrolase